MDCKYKCIYEYVIKIVALIENKVFFSAFFGPTTIKAFYQKRRCINLNKKKIDKPDSRIGGTKKNWKVRRYKHILIFLRFLILTRCIFQLSTIYLE